MSTGRAIDHIVLAVDDLDQAATRYESLGFKLTPRAAHEDRMGTSNRLAQFANHSFIELLEVDRPERLAPHDPSSSPAFFGFGDHNRQYLARRRGGASMLAFAGQDARADLDAFHTSGVASPAYAPFDFERGARLPDGRQVTVSFSLVFATSDDMPGVAFFVCQNRAQEYFWKPAFQQHDNGALGIETVYLASTAPTRDGAFVASLFGGEARSVGGGVAVACGDGQAIHVLSPDVVIRQHDPLFDYDPDFGPVFAGIALRTRQGRRTITSDQGCGMFIEWAEHRH